MRSFVTLRHQGQRPDMRKYNEAVYQMELQTWRPYRIFALFSAFCALCFTTIAISNRYWYIGKGFHSGIWDLCHFNITRVASSSRTSVDNCADKKPCIGLNTNIIIISWWQFSFDWQNAVIGLLIFSVAFGFLATILSICGVCTTQLAKKIYYYHSAGEIYLICALATAAGLVVYPVAIEVNQSLGVHSFGVGYGLGWVASMFFLASALCMCLDDLVRAFARGMCKCCRRDTGSDTRV